MTDAKDNGHSAQDAVKSAIERHGSTRAELIPILMDINKALGYLPGEALEKLSHDLRVPKSEIFSVASFYQMLSTKAVGKHVVQFCESAPCHVVGGRQVWLALQDSLGLKAGETSKDGLWTLHTTSCLGACGVGPVVVVDEDMYGNVTPDQLPGILARYH
jgi:NADH:ubiquinone oxidoreductase subunit E